MICYADRTFCSFWKRCQRGNSCNRALTDIVKDRASAAGLPIAQFIEKPECFKGKGKKK